MAPGAVARQPPVEIIGVPLDLGAGRRGTDMGPSALRIARLGEQIAALGCQVTDRGNVAAALPETESPKDTRKKFIAPIASVCRQLYRAASAAHAAGALPLVVGGDHSVAAGSVAATAAAARRHRGRIGLVWIDAHADMNTPATTTSGNVHGMPLAALLGPDPRELATIGRRGPSRLDPDHVALIGIRSLDSQERTQVRDSGVTVFTMKEVDRLGMAAVATQALALAGEGTTGVHVSFDLDVCDPSIAPGVGTPVRGGLSYREAHLLMETVADSGLLRALDLVEINPTLDRRNETAELAVELALSALGHRIL